MTPRPLLPGLFLCLAASATAQAPTAGSPWLPPLATRSAEECRGVVAPPWNAGLDYPRPEVRMPSPPERGPVDGRAGVFISAAGTLDSVETADFLGRDGRDYERRIRAEYAKGPARPATYQGCAVAVWFRWRVIRPADLAVRMPSTAVDTPRAVRDSIRCAGVVAPPGVEGVQPEVRIALPPKIKPGRLSPDAGGGVFISAAGTLDSVEITGFPEPERKEYEKRIRKEYAPKPIQPAVFRGCAVGAWFRWQVSVPNR